MDRGLDTIASKRGRKLVVGKKSTKKGVSTRNNSGKNASAKKAIDSGTKRGLTPKFKLKVHPSLASNKVVVVNKNGDPVSAKRAMAILNQQSKSLAMVSGAASIKQRRIVDPVIRKVTPKRMSATAHMPISRKPPRSLTKSANGKVLTVGAEFVTARTILKNTSAPRKMPQASAMTDGYGMSSSAYPNRRQRGPAPHFSSHSPYGRTLEVPGTDFASSPYGNMNSSTAHAMSNNVGSRMQSMHLREPPVPGEYHENPHDVADIMVRANLQVARSRLIPDSLTPGL